jgi:hypothetical protein
MSKITLIAIILAGAFCLLTADAVSGFEYFFDTDPGPGNGIQINPRNTLDIDQTIPTTGLSQGFHRLYVRAKSENGRWGLPNRCTFYITVPSSPNVTPEGSITGFEYFFDSDPGPGNGIPVALRDVEDVDLTIPTAILSEGFHRVYVRASSATGKWSVPQRTTFYIPVGVEPRPSIVDITHLEYYLDADPGTGQGTLATLTPGVNIDQYLPLDMQGIAHGNHNLFIRLRNSSGTWGLPAYRIFSDGVPAFVSITEAGGNVVLSWQDLYQIDTYQVYSGPGINGPFSLDSTGVFGESSWTAPMPVDPQKFFHVTSVYQYRPE